MKTLIIIPSRLAATRLPGKPLLKINGLSIISHVFKKAETAKIGDVLVATENQEIVDDVKKNGGQAVLTSNKHNTGTDRIYEALKKTEISNIDLVMNLQGDEPLIDIDDIRNLNQHMINSNSRIGTLASKIFDKKLYDNQSAVKVKTRVELNHNNFPEAIYFKRKTLKKDLNLYHHVGIYCYEIDTLKDFVSYKQSSYETKYKLEQLRALENKININVALAKSHSIGIDTKEDFMAIKKIMEYKT